MNKILPLLSLVLLLTSCTIRVLTPVPVLLSELSGNRYFIATIHQFESKEYRGQWGVLVRTDGTSRILKDDSGKEVVFSTNIEMMNYFGAQGWRYTDRYNELRRGDEVRQFLLFERDR